MAKNNIEIEIRFPLNNMDTVLAKLHKIAEFKYDNRQIDTYYNAPHRDLFERAPSVDEWLRLRDSDGEFSINLKSFFPRGAKKSTHCEEYESKIENIDNLKSIFSMMDFKPVIVVDKQRRAFKYKNTEIAIDTIATLGDFIEIEYDCDDNCDIDAANKYLYEILTEIGAEVGPEYLVGYAFDLMKRAGLIKGQVHVEE